MRVSEHATCTQRILGGAEDVFERASATAA